MSLMVACKKQLVLLEKKKTKLQESLAVNVLQGFVPLLYSLGYFLWRWRMPLLFIFIIFEWFSTDKPRERWTRGARKTVVYQNRKEREKYLISVYFYQRHFFIAQIKIIIIIISGNASKNSWDRKKKRAGKGMHAFFLPVVPTQWTCS